MSIPLLAFALVALLFATPLSARPTVGESSEYDSDSVYFPRFSSVDSDSVSPSERFTPDFPSAGFPIINKPQYRSPNYTPYSGTRSINSIILHYTGGNLDGSLSWFHDPDSKVSSHYMIAPNGTVYLIVNENDIAWHAGVSFWRGTDGLNSVSIGIEIVNPGVEDPTKIPLKSAYYPAVQIQSVFWLVNQIKSRYNIKIQRIAGHSDIAPNRKADPGEFFPWKSLMTQYANPPMFNCTSNQKKTVYARYGQGSASNPNPVVMDIQNKLFAAGYGIANNYTESNWQPRGAFGAFDDDMAFTVVAYRRRFNQPPASAYGSGWSKPTIQTWSQCDDLILDNILALFPPWQQ